MKDEKQFKGSWTCPNIEQVIQEDEKQFYGIELAVVTSKWQL